jgi:protein-S-isoprenylcysteine O-methyltransferase Ste14
VSDSPGVHVPPPFFYVAAMVAGVLLRRYEPLPIGGGTLRVVGSWICVAAFLAIVAWSFLSFYRKRTTVIPNRPANALVIAGPYRFTRNPMYVAMALLTLGVGLWRDTWWIPLLLVLSLIVIDRLVIAREEAYLRRRFGEEYDTYTRRVRRWI